MKQRNNETAKQRNTELIINRPGNVYFHFRVKCVREKQPSFIPALVFISPFVAQFLNDSDRLLIRTELGIVL